MNSALPKNLRCGRIAPGASDTAAAGPRTVPVRSSIADTKAPECSRPRRPSDVLRAGTARARWLCRDAPNRTAPIAPLHPQRHAIETRRFTQQRGPVKKSVLLATALCANLELASAQTLFVVRLNSAQEVPTNSSIAVGSGTLTLNADRTLNYDISYSGLAADFLAAHIHGPAGPGTNAPVLFPLTNVATNNRSGAL